jgi:hypothetical protein
MPWRHRRWLRREARAFDRLVRARFDGRPFEDVELHDWTVLPFEDLLRRPIGGRAYRGGPVMADPERWPALRHFRYDFCVDEPVGRIGKGRAAAVQPVAGRLFWCGPICRHFGHQIADFSGRVLLSSLDPRPGRLLWHAVDGASSVAELSEWQQTLLAHLNPGEKEILLMQGPIRAERLVVIPQQTRLRAAPTPAHLAALTRRQRAIRPVPAAPVVYLSRSKFSPCEDAVTLKGAVAGEASFERMLSEQGVQVVHPERMALADQVRLYRSAPALIVAEGSAQHGLELLGFDAGKRVLVICRRPPLPAMDYALRARFPLARFVNAVRTSWCREGGLHWTALAVVDWTVISDALVPLGLRLDSDARRRLDRAADEQLRVLSSRVPLREQRLP